MPPKKAAELVITPEEEEVLNQLLVEQMATLKPGVDYPLKRVANGLGAVIDALNAGESADEALEHFLTELDVYAFDMSRYTTVVAGNRAQQIEYDEEEVALEAKTAELKAQFAKLGTGKTALVIDGEAGNGFLAARNLIGVNVLPAVGANVYDILKHDTLVLTRAAVEKLEARFNG